MYKNISKCWHIIPWKNWGGQEGRELREAGEGRWWSWESSWDWNMKLCWGGKTMCQMQRNKTRDMPEREVELRAGRVGGLAKIKRREMLLRVFYGLSSMVWQVIGKGHIEGWWLQRPKDSDFEVEREREVQIAWYIRLRERREREREREEPSWTHPFDMASVSFRYTCLAHNLQ